MLTAYGRLYAGRSLGKRREWERQGEAMVRAVVQIVAGVLLVFGRHTLVRGWSRIRGQTFHVEPDDDEEANL